MCIALGYDAIVGIVISAVAAVIGFNVGGISFYNTGIAQTVSGLPLFSGLGFRLIVLQLQLLSGLLTHLYIAARLKKTRAKVSFTISISAISHRICRMRVLHLHGRIKFHLSCL